MNDENGIGEHAHRMVAEALRDEDACGERLGELRCVLPKGHDGWHDDEKPVWLP